MKDTNCFVERVSWFRICATGSNKSGLLLSVISVANPGKATFNCSTGVSSDLHSNAAVSMAETSMSHASDGSVSAIHTACWYCRAALIRAFCLPGRAVREVSEYFQAFVQVRGSRKTGNLRLSLKMKLRIGLAVGSNGAPERSIARPKFPIQGSSLQPDAYKKRRQDRHFIEIIAAVVMLEFILHRRGVSGIAGRLVMVRHPHHHGRPESAARLQIRLVLRNA
jgi:hypothetical protein